MTKRTAEEAGAAARDAKRTKTETALGVFLGPTCGVTPEAFLKDYYGKKHLLVKNGAGFFKDMEFVTLERTYKTVEKYGEDALDWGFSIEAVRAVDGKKEKMSPPSGAVKLDKLKELYEKEKCTLQFHQPQNLDPHLARACSRLEDHFSTTFGSNTYLTPAGAQGLAPHYDCVDVFVCQIKGKKHWKLHAGIVKHPIDRDPMEDSGDLDMDEKKLGPKLDEFTLEEGDMLYMPRGTVHYATTSDEESCHITFSTADDNYMGSFLFNTLQNAVSLATDEVEELRRNLPSDSMQVLGKFSEAPEERRNEMKELVKGMLAKLEPFLMEAMDAAADSKAMDFCSRRLPPATKIDEKSCIPGDVDEEDFKEKAVEEVPSVGDDDLIQLAPKDKCWVRAVQPSGAEAPGLDDFQACLAMNEEMSAEGADEVSNEEILEAAKKAVAQAEEDGKNNYWLLDNIENRVVGHMFDAAIPELEGLNTSRHHSFKKEFKKAFQKILSGEATAVRELDGMLPDKTDVGEFRMLLGSLASQGILEIVKSKSS